MMLEATVLLLSFTDQNQWGFSGKNGIALNCSTDVDDAWYGSLCHVFTKVIRYDIYKGANQGGLCAANREIIEIGRAYRPRYVIYPCNFSGIVTEATLAALREMGCLVVADFFDDDVYFEPYSRWLLPYLDYVITHVSPLVEKYRKLGARCLLTPAIPMNPAVLCRLRDRAKRYDASFVGSLYSYRRDYLARIAACGSPVNYLGGGNERKLHSARMVGIINQSCINLNFSSGQVGRQIIVGRVFEVPLCGGFLLTEYFPGLEQWFEIGREIECFATAREAAAKINYFLEHPVEREQIAARGYERAAGSYTGPVLLTKVFRDIEEDYSLRGRPDMIPASRGVNTLRQADAEQYFTWIRGLLRSPAPLREEWRETADLVLATDPLHQGAARLVRRAGKWGDPEPLAGRVRATAHRIRSWGSWVRAHTKRVSFGAVARRGRGLVNKALWSLGSPLRFTSGIIRRWLKSRYGLTAVPPHVLYYVHRVSRILTWSASPLFPPFEEIDCNVADISDPEINSALQNQVLTLWNFSVESLNWLVSHIEKTQTCRVLEYGSGLSTIAWAIACRRNAGDRDCGPPHVIAVDENEEYAARTRRLLADLHLDHLAVVVHWPLVDRELDGRIVKGYSPGVADLDLFKSGWRADVLFVDGPTSGDLSRALAIIDGLQWASEECLVVMDDALRDDEIRSIHHLRTHRHFACAGVVLIGKGIALGRRQPPPMDIQPA